MATHTPGPWTVELIPDDMFGIRANGERYYIARCSTGGLRKQYKRSKESAQANASLIAAAPDLLAALKAVQPFIKDQQAFNATCAAIAKAEGR